MERLQLAESQALHLRAVHGLTHSEMAGQLAMTPAQVKALLHRARLSARRAWNQAGNWALAPLAALRQLRKGGRNALAGPAGAPALGMATILSGPFAPVADKIVASAVLAAVTLAAPSVSSPVRHAGDTARARTRIAAGPLENVSRPLPNAPGSQAQTDAGTIRADLDPEVAIEPAGDFELPPVDLPDPNDTVEEVVRKTRRELDRYGRKPKTPKDEPPLLRDIHVQPAEAVQDAKDAVDDEVGKVSKLGD